jgi:serine/threonine protein kinase/Tol biopolymer transport system component
MSLNPGTRLGRYEVRSKIGEGGMGEVYLAEDTQLSRRVALKLLPAQAMREHESLRRFQQEARAASALSHPNIAHIYEIGESDGVNFIAMEYVAGQSLNERINRRPLPASEVAHIGAQVADALDEAHQAGVTHRDIKSANVMLTARGRVKVLDFGLAKVVAPETESEAATRVKTKPGVVMGTVSYMSPEQAMGRDVDARTDIWSLGVVLYEMATGRLPFSGDSVTETIDAIAHSQPEAIARFNYDVPAELEVVIKKALRKKREERYQTARDMHVDLQSLARELELIGEHSVSHDARSSSSGAAQAQTITDTSVASLTGAQSDALRGEQATQTLTREQSATTDAVAAERTTSSAEYVVKKIKRHKKGAVAVLAVLALAVAGLAFVLNKFSAKKPAPFQSIKITKLTNIGNANAAHISPNGEYVAHVVYEGGKNSVRVWDVATKSSVEIIPPTEDAIFISTFSPDSRYIYYRRNVSGQPSALYQVAVFGGMSKKILETTNTGITFSPDGKRFASMRTGPGQGETSIIIANADGSNEQTLATRKGSERFGTSGASWSPDGKVIACAVNTDGTNMTIAAVSVADGTVKPITSQKWLVVNRVAWLRDGSGLVFSAVEQDVPQIWYVSYPEGDVRRITNDANIYGTGSVSITADSSTIATVQIEYLSNISVAPASDAAHAKQITPVGAERGRAWGVCWTPDGKIVHSTIASGNTNIWIVNADGTGNRQLTNETEGAIGPAVSPDGRYVVFNSMRSGRYNLWRMDMDGGHPKQLTGGGDEEAPGYSPDGRWVIYDSVATSDLRKVPIEGGDSVRLTDRRVTWPAVSPKDGMIAGLYRSDDNSPERLAVFPAEGGTPIKSFDLPPGSFGGARWAPDGHSILYVVTRAETSSLWSQSLDAGAPKQLADFSPEQIFSFDLSRDGRWLALARGTIIRDVILITDSKQ